MPCDALFFLAPSTPASLDSQVHDDRVRTAPVRSIFLLRIPAILGFLWLNFLFQAFRLLVGREACLAPRFARESRSATLALAPLIPCLDRGFHPHLKKRAQ